MAGNSVCIQFLNEGDHCRIAFSFKMEENARLNCRNGEEILSILIILPIRDTG